MRSRLSDDARHGLHEDVQRMTAEQRLAAFLAHSQLTAQLAKAAGIDHPPPRDAVSPNAR